jgi:oxygen-independent coproporphyrinogen-3 oxidase
VCHIKHLYVHVPFCTGKCIYCSFYSILFDDALCRRYLDALEREIEAAAAIYPLQPATVYIGGGTPTRLPPAELDSLILRLKTHLDLRNVKEWTIEGTPETLTKDRLFVLRNHGVTRISAGAQSMTDGVLSLISRRHTASQTAHAMQNLIDAGFENIGLDLIACLPGDTAASWERSVASTINLAPQHISVYALSADPGSRLHEMHQRGQWHPPGTEQEQTALTMAATLLEDAGYERYEISNYALPGHECRHNEAIWQGADYVGFGPAAASRVGCDRWHNAPDLLRYCEGMEGSKGHPPRSKDVVSPQTDAAERLMFAFRLCRGVNVHAFAEQYGDTARALLPAWLRQLNALATEGLLMTEGSHWKLTPRGLNYADTVAERLLP